MAVGGLLLIFGLQWLRKAVLRGAGLKAKHDELETFTEETEAARAAGRAGGGFDGYSFAIAFKGVLLEGLEVAFIVLTFGANQHNVGLAAAAAAAAVLVVIARGRGGARPARAGAREHDEARRRRDAELVRDVLGRRGRRARWPGGDAALLAIVPGVLLAAVAMVGGRCDAARRAPRTAEAAERGGGRLSAVVAFLRGVWDFIVGDDWRTAIGVVVALGVTALIAQAGNSAWWVMPLAVLGLLALSIARAARGASRRG